MPFRKKKFLPRKKKIIESNFTSKGEFQQQKHEDITRVLGPAASVKKPCLACKEYLNNDFDKGDPRRISQKCVNDKIDKGGVKRIMSPFNRFANNSTRITDQNKIALITKCSYQNAYRPPGLSPKERSYVISSCQSRSTRYPKLKTLAANAIQENKIFTIYGSCNPVRKALLERGWVEKMPANRMNLTKIRNGSISSNTEIHGELERLLLSNLVEKSSPNFIWRNKEEHCDTTIDMSREYTTLVNKLKIDAMWTSKQGLCFSMKRNYWFYIEDVAEVICPRTYNTYDVGETEGFVNDYKITACTSLLKWVLTMDANDKPVFIESGNISLNVVVFALNRCSEYLLRKQNKDIDRNLNGVSAGQWNAFLKKYNRIIAKEDVFRADVNNKLPLYLGYAKFLLKEIYEYRPQLSCEGCHSIWIIKPANNSRGRGIRLASNLGVITNLLKKVNVKYVIQKYIEEPLLIYDTKFDIRQYYLVTSTCPLEIWMYKDCYLKFSSQKYNLKNYHESIHLTNNAVQRKYVNCTGRHSELPEYNMWDLDKYKDYLKKIGKGEVWETIIYPGMRKSIVGIMLSCQDYLSVCKNRFELYGCDFILDKEFKPWLIEINSCPDLKHTTVVTAKICPAVLSDIIKVVIDRAHDRNAPTGNFERIYRQPLTIPRYGAAGDLYIRGCALPDGYFYKGKIEIKESYDADIGKECNIKTILKTLKQFYDSEMEMISKGTSTCSIELDYAMPMPSKAATVISEAVEELLDTVTLEHNVSSKSESKFESVSPQSSLCKQLVRCVKSVTDITSLLRSSYNCFTSTKAISMKQSFSFADLDDGSLGTGS